LHFTIEYVNLVFGEVKISPMLKGAICFFAFSIFLFGCTTKIARHPAPPPPSDPRVALPEQTVSGISPSEEKVKVIEEAQVIPETDQKAEIEETKGSQEDVVREVEKAEREVEKDVALLTPPSAPPKLEVHEESHPLSDLTILNLFLDRKKRLVVTLANIGNSPFSMGTGSLKIFLDDRLKERYGLESLSKQRILQPNENITFTTSLTIRGRREVHAYVETDPETRELNKENNSLKRILEGVPTGPDISVRDLDLTEDFELFILLSNEGEIDLRRGVTFQIRVFVNNLRVSEFEHFTSDVLKANAGNHYAIYPPYRVVISGTSRVRIAISTKLPTDDVSSENNVLMRTFVIFPFTIIPQGKQEFSFSVPSPLLTDAGQTKKLKAEVRWEGGGAPIMLSYTGPDHVRKGPAFSGESPVKLEFPIHFAEVQKKNLWKFSMTNLIERRVEGYLIIQHP
jgi:hypothetical protein